MRSPLGSLRDRLKKFSLFKALTDIAEFETKTSTRELEQKKQAGGGKTKHTAIIHGSFLQSVTCFTVCGHQKERSCEAMVRGHEKRLVCNFKAEYSLK